jgi:hypothetical protein
MHEHSPYAENLPDPTDCLSGLLLAREADPPHSLAYIILLSQPTLANSGLEHVSVLDNRTTHFHCCWFAISQGERDEVEVRRSKKRATASSNQVGHGQLG